MKTNTTSRFIQRVIALGACVSAASFGSAAFADSEWGDALEKLLAVSIDEMKTGIDETKVAQTVVVKNQHNQKRKFYWTAAGCAGISDGVTYVCHSSELNANGRGEYTFKLGTSQRHLQSRSIQQGDSCNHKFDINTTGSPTIGNATVLFGCSDAAFENLAKPPGSAPKPTIAHVLFVDSKRNVPVTLVVGAPGCTDTVYGLPSVCAALRVGPDSQGALRFSSGTKEGGFVTWFEGNRKVGVVKATQRSVRLTVPEKGDQIILN